jgi:hypothetical protein
MAISNDTRLIKVHINIRIYKQELLDTWEYSSVTLGEQLNTIFQPVENPYLQKITEN